MKKSGVRSPGSRSKADSGKLKVRLRASDSQLRTLIIGYGNPLRSDDAFGWHASRLLAQVLTGQDVDVITCHQLTPELAEQLSRCRRAVFIDADAAGQAGRNPPSHCPPPGSGKFFFYAHLHAFRSSRQRQTALRSPPASHHHHRHRPVFRIWRCPLAGSVRRPPQGCGAGLQVGGAYRRQSYARRCVIVAAREESLARH